MIAFTGARKVAHYKVLYVVNSLAEIAERTTEKWLVGDANGVDALVRGAAEYHEKDTEIFEVEGYQPYHFAKRSKRMIDRLREADSPMLYAFPDKDCPRNCTPNNTDGHGSGTWLTVAMARKLDIPVVFYPLAKVELPSWTQTAQLSLF